jgi:hypothetical protein
VSAAIVFRAAGDDGEIRLGFGLVIEADGTLCANLPARTDRLEDPRALPMAV